MSSPLRVANEIMTKLIEIKGLLTIREKHPVPVGAAVAWIFDQLPEDYLEKLKEDVLGAMTFSPITFSPMQKEKMIARVAELIKEGKIVMPEKHISIEEYLEHMDAAVRKSLLPSSME